MGSVTKKEGENKCGDNKIVPDVGCFENIKYTHLPRRKEINRSFSSLEPDYGKPRIPGQGLELHLVSNTELLQDERGIPGSSV